MMDENFLRDLYAAVDNPIYNDFAAVVAISNVIGFLMSQAMDDLEGLCTQDKKPHPIVLHAFKTAVGKAMHSTLEEICVIAARHVVKGDGEDMKPSDEMVKKINDFAIDFLKKASERLASESATPTTLQ